MSNTQNAVGSALPVNCLFDCGVRNCRLLTVLELDREHTTRSEGNAGQTSSPVLRETAVAQRQVHADNASCNNAHVASNTVQAHQRGCSLTGGRRHPASTLTPAANGGDLKWCVWAHVDKKGAGGALRQSSSQACVHKLLLAAYQALKAGGWKKGRCSFPALSSVYVCS
jgi:hypothetical protein